MGASCTGYRWSQGQYMMTNCMQESSAFFIILGFTMLVLVVLLGLILVIACFRRQRRTNAAPSTTGPPGSQENCIIQMEGLGAGAGQYHGKDLESVKCVIMAGEDQPTFLAHPVMPLHRKAESDEDELVKEKEQEGLGETSKPQQEAENV